MTTPKIIFVDGFNASGKDYAIDKITQELQARGYTPLLGDPRYFLPKVIASKRFYTFKYFDRETNTAITNGHILALKDYIDKLNAAPDNAVIVVNRSYLSTMVYNHVASTDDNYNDVGEMISFFVDEEERFKEAYQKTIGDIRAVMFVLSRHYDAPECDTDTSIKLLKEKILRRDGTTSFDDLYLEYLLSEYSITPCLFEELGITTTHGHSGQTKEFMDAHFPALHGSDT